MTTYKHQKYYFDYWWPGDSGFYPGQDSTGGAAQAARKVARAYGWRFEIRSQSHSEGGRGVHIERVE